MLITVLQVRMNYTSAIDIEQSGFPCFEQVDTDLLNSRLQLVISLYTKTILNGDGRQSCTYIYNNNIFKLQQYSLYN